VGAPSAVEEPKKDDKKEPDFWQDVLPVVIDQQTKPVRDLFGYIKKTSDDIDKNGFVAGNMPNGIGAGGGAENVRGVGDSLGVIADQTQQIKANEAKAAEDDARAKYQQSLGGGGGAYQVRQLSQEEWDMLSPERQKSITANYALYNARQADLALGKDEKHAEGYDSQVTNLFGDKGGSDSYAPNTVKVLEQLGFTPDKNADLDQFLNGSVITSEQDLDNKGAGLQGAQARQTIFDQLGQSKGFATDALVASLGQGKKVLDALRDDSSFTPDVLKFAGVTPSVTSQLNDSQRKDLDQLMSGLTRNDVWEAANSDKSTADALKQDLADMTSQYGADTIQQYIKENYPAENDGNHITYEDFLKRWIKGA